MRQGVICIVLLCLWSCSSQGDAPLPSDASTPSAADKTLGEVILSYDDMLGATDQDAAMPAGDIVEIQLSKDLRASLSKTYSNLHLVEMTMTIPASEGETASALFAEVVQAFDHRYGTSKPAQGYATWSTPSARGRLVEVSLTDGSVTYGKAAIIAEWSEYQDRKYVD